MNIRTVLLIIFALPLLMQAQNKPLATPSEKQIRFADWEVGAFIHYGLNPFTDMEHGDGQNSPIAFNPTEQDVEQWVITAKKLGARYACLTARHEGGFCLWPSKTTDYTIANSPYLDGKGDIVREFVDACRKHDIVPALYHTAGFDANAAIGKYEGDLELPLEWMTTWGQAVGEGLNRPGHREKFKQIQIEQMRELLTNYGPIGFMWSDHWDATDPDGVWRAVTDVAYELQPDMVFMGPDSWVPGNEMGHVVYPMWNAVHTVDGTNNSRPSANNDDLTTSNNYGLLEGEVRTGHPMGEFWRVRECTTNSAFSYGGWFWHPDSIKPTHPKRTWEHVDLYYRTVGLGANTIINLPPDTRGLIPEDIAEAAELFGNEIRQRFSNPIAETKKVIKGNTVDLKWRKAREINTIVTMENIATGQRISKYDLQAYVNGQWQSLEPKNRLEGFAPYNNNPGYETVGHKKIDRVEPVTTNRIRFVCLESVQGEAEIRRLSVYNNAPIVREYGAGYPYLSGVETLSESAHNGVRRDVNYEGAPIVMDGKTYKCGLMVCPVEQSKKGYVNFNLESFPDAVGFTADIGIDDLRTNGSVVFIAEGLVADQWQELYHSPVMRTESEMISIDVPLKKNIEQLRLIVTDGGDIHWNDHAVWANAKFYE